MNLNSIRIRIMHKIRIISIVSTRTVPGHT